MVKHCDSNIKHRDSGKRDLDILRGSKGIGFIFMGIWVETMGIVCFLMFGILTMNKSDIL
jgi:hypothetical protein